MNTRLRAAQILAGVVSGQSLSPLLSALELEAIGSQDRAFVKALCFGALRWYPKINLMLQSLMRKPLAKREKLLHALLCIGIYQLKYMAVATHAALYETVQAVHLLDKPWAVGLVNGVLRAASRDDTLMDLSFDECRYAHPTWLIELIHKDWPQNFEKILAANNQAPPCTLRVNLQRISRTDYQQRLLECGLESKPIGDLPALVLTQAQDIRSLPGFNEGHISVQDAGAMWAAKLLQLKAGQRVLDACSAPGGKTSHMLEEQPGIELLALEIDGKRIVRLRDNLRRLKHRAHVRQGDATQLASWWSGQTYHRILLDAPCSGTGVIRRHPDIKLLRRASDIAALAATQYALLANLWQILEPGGLLLYLTCSLLRAENDEVIARFLEASPDACQQAIHLITGQATIHGWQILPGEDQQDGFYYALLGKMPRNA